MSTCDTCKHWHPYRETSLFEGMGVCQNDKTTQPVYGPETAYKANMASLSTGPKFGCIHHQEKGES